MRTPFLVVDAPVGHLAPGEVVTLTTAQCHHLGRVLRRRDGDDVEVSDGAGSVASGRLVGTVVELTAEPVFVTPPPPGVHVLHALPKRRGGDEALRTLAELGVARVSPVVTERAEVRPGGHGAERALARWRDIVRVAAEQSRSPWVCVVDPVCRLTDVPAGGDTVLRVVAHPAAPTPLGQVVADAGAVSAVRLAVGPEGGFTDGEVTRLEAAGWAAASLGPTVLRSVNAGVVMTAAVMALGGRYGPSSACAG